MMLSSRPTLLDLDTLLAPIDEHQLSGTDIREDASPNSLYYSLKSLRAEARAHEREALIDEEENAVDPGDQWRRILDTATQVLVTRSKDLEVVAWLLEALVRLEGFTGLRDGFRLARELIDRYWDRLYPLPDEDGIATRMAPLIGLNGFEGEGTLIAPILWIPLTSGRDSGPFCTWQCRQAFETDRIADEAQKRQRLEDGALSLEVLNAAIRGTGAAFFRQTHQDLLAAMQEYQGLQASIDRVCGEAPQPTSQIKNALEQCAETLRFIAKDALAAEQDDSEAEQASPEGGVESNGAHFSGKVQSRRQALKLLEQVAAYFRSAEPHSPISYQLDQAIRWSSLPLPELLGELIEDRDARRGYFKLAGIKIDPQE